MTEFARYVNLGEDIVAVDEQGRLSGLYRRIPIVTIGTKQNRLYEPRRPPNDEISKSLPELDHLAHAAMIRQAVESLKHAKID